MSPHWLFFPTQSTDPQYIYTAVTDNSVVRGTVQSGKRKQESTGTESGDLADQFSPFSSNSQYELFGSDTIRFKVNNSDTSSSDYGSKTDISNNMTSATLTVGSNTFTAESISVGGTDARPRIQLQSSGGGASTFWSANNLDDTDDITITITLTF